MKKVDNNYKQKIQTLKRSSVHMRYMQLTPCPITPQHWFNIDNALEYI
jgi:hypothetical protein